MSASAWMAPMDHRARLDRLQAALGGIQVDGMLISDPTHVRYLTGFTGSSGYLLVVPDSVSLVTDSRYGEIAEDLAATIGGVGVVVGSRQSQIDRTRVEVGSWRRIGLEAEAVTWKEARAYESDWFPEAEVVATTGVVAELRLVKDAAEIARIERAASITDHALAEVRDLLSSEPTERGFQICLDRAIVDAGADDMSFPTIVASGPNAARPHHNPGDRMIVAGDLVVVDVGALVDGYHSDMTRTFLIGSGSDEARSMLDVALAAHAAGVGVVAPGVTGDEVDRAARAVIAAAGMSEEFVHGVGHGVGLLIHEDPFMLGSHLPLVEGQVVTVEPGVYRSRVGGVRIEDTVLVTNDGCRPLTLTPKEPLVS